MDAHFPRHEAEAAMLEAALSNPSPGVPLAPPSNETFKHTLGIRFSFDVSAIRARSVLLRHDT